MDKVLIIGLGSIGQRHLRNLLSIKKINVIAYRKRGNALPTEFNSTSIDTYNDLDLAIAQNPDFCLICAPPVVQSEVMGKIIKAKIPFFIEKPISPSMDNMSGLLEEVKLLGLTTMVGYNLRCHPIHGKIKEILSCGKLGKIVSARASVGQYLPDWHPMEDYRLGYSANKELGGGVILDLIHEIDFLYSIFGEVIETKSMFSKNSSLDISTEDTAEILMKFKSGIIGSVHLDYVQRKPFRNGIIIGDLGTLTYDLLNAEAKILLKDSEDTIKIDHKPNDMYLKEMHIFLDALAGGKPIESNLQSGLEVLKIALKAKSNL